VGARIGVPSREGKTWGLIEQTWGWCQKRNILLKKNLLSYKTGFKFLDSEPIRKKKKTKPPCENGCSQGLWW
jgi:hypothetical protein